MEQGFKPKWNGVLNGLEQGLNPNGTGFKNRMEQVFKCKWNRWLVRYMIHLGLCPRPHPRREAPPRALLWEDAEGCSVSPVKVCRYLSLPPLGVSINRSIPFDRLPLQFCLYCFIVYKVVHLKRQIFSYSIIVAELKWNIRPDYPFGRRPNKLHRL